MPNIDEAIEALLAYQQADMEGVMVLTSRQAIHEVADELKRLRDFEQWATAWHNTCETIMTLLDLPGGGSPQEMLEQVQARGVAQAPEQPTGSDAVADGARELADLLSAVKRCDSYANPESSLPAKMLAYEAALATPQAPAQTLQHHTGDGEGKSDNGRLS